MEGAESPLLYYENTMRSRTAKCKDAPRTGNMKLRTCRQISL